MANALVRTLLLVPAYVTILAIPETGAGLLHTMESLMHIDCYMRDVIIAVQGGANPQRDVFDGTVRSLKWIFLSLAGGTKDPV